MPATATQPQPTRYQWRAALNQHVRKTQTDDHFKIADEFAKLIPAEHARGVLADLLQPAVRELVRRDRSIVGRDTRSHTPVAIRGHNPHSRLSRLAEASHDGTADILWGQHYVPRIKGYMRLKDMKHEDAASTAEGHRAQERSSGVQASKFEALAAKLKPGSDKTAGDLPAQILEGIFA